MEITGQTASGERTKHMSQEITTQVNITHLILLLTIRHPLKPNEGRIRTISQVNRYTSILTSFLCQSLMQGKKTALYFVYVLLNQPSLQVEQNCPGIVQIVQAVALIIAQTNLVVIPRYVPNQVNILIKY